MTDNKMTLNEYQERVYLKREYSDNVKIIYPALGLISKIGKIADRIGCWLNDDEGVALDIDMLLDELGDVLQYVSALVSDLDLTLKECVEHETIEEFDLGTKNFEQKIQGPKSVKEHTITLAEDVLHLAIDAEKGDFNDRYLKGEILDALHAMSCFARALDLSLEVVAQRNLAKLFNYVKENNFQRLLNEGRFTLGTDL